MISSDLVFLALILSSIATYLCRSFGVLFSSSLKEESEFFEWIRLVSIGIIVAVISKIIFFPDGILENTSNIIRNVIFLLCILSIIAAIFITKDIDKIYCRGNYFDRSKDIDCPEGTILNGLIDPLPWERIEGDINTCCSPLYCTGNPDSNNDFNCPEDMIAINNSENIKSSNSP